MKLFVFRHGQTDANVLDLCQGDDMDYPLNEKGLQQAEELREALKDAGLEIILASPMKRALTTAKIVASANNTPIEIIADLKEGCMGIAQGKHMDWYTDNYSDLAKARFVISDPEFWDAAIEGMESRRDVWERAKKVFEIIKRDYAQYSKIGVATHGFFIQTMYAGLFGELPKMISNCGVLEIDLA